MTDDKDPRKKRFYHGGDDGLKVGDYILPSKDTRKNNMIGQNPLWREDRVYLTKNIGDAWCFAARSSIPRVYEVNPFGELEYDPDLPAKGISFQCPKAKIIALYDEPPGIVEYSNDRSEIIWTDADITHVKKTCSLEIAHAVDLAAHTGLRLGDLLRLSWSHIGDDAITLPTGKSRYRREAVIPLYGALRDVLLSIPKCATTVLTSSKRRPWTADGFGSSFNKAKIDAGMAERDLHFNDLRGTAATKFYVADFNMREIAETLAWEEKSVEKIIRRYVGRSAAIRERIKKLESKR